MKKFLSVLLTVVMIATLCIGSSVTTFATDHSSSKTVPVEYVSEEELAEMIRENRADLKAVFSDPITRSLMKKYVTYTTPVSRDYPDDYYYYDYYDSDDVHWEGNLELVRVLIAYGTDGEISGYAGKYAGYVHARA